MGQHTPFCQPPNTCMFFRDILVLPSKPLLKNQAWFITNQFTNPFSTTRDKLVTSKPTPSFSASRSEKSSKLEPITNSSTTWKTYQSQLKTWMKKKIPKSSWLPMKSNLPANWPKSLKKKLKMKKENKKTSSNSWEIKSLKIKSLNLKVFQNLPDFFNKKLMGDTLLDSKPLLSQTENKKQLKKLWKILSSSKTFF